MSSFHEKLAEHARMYPILYDKSSQNFKNRSKKENLACGDGTAAINLKLSVFTYTSYKELQIS